MTLPNFERALIVGAGSGLSASLARLFAREGMQVALAARNPPSSMRSARRPAPARSRAMRRARTR